MATEKVVVPLCVSTIGTKSRSELDDQSRPGVLARVSSECKYAGCLNESDQYVIDTNDIEPTK